MNSANWGCQLFQVKGLATYAETYFSKDYPTQDEEAREKMFLFSRALAAFSKTLNRGVMYNEFLSLGEAEQTRNFLAGC